MNKLTITLLFTGFFMSGNGQVIEQAKTNIYYHRFTSAKNELRQAINSGQQDPDAWYWLGEIYLSENKPDSAKQVFLDGMALVQKRNYSSEEHPLLFIGNAHLLLYSGHATAARSQMEEIAKNTKYKDPEALTAMAKAIISSKEGDIPWAIELLEKAARRDKKNPAIYLAIGDAYHKQVNGSQAVINYDKALELNPQYAEAYYKKGLIYKTQKNTEVYTGEFTKAVEADSTYAPALYELYYHYFYRDIARAGELLTAYIRHSDPSLEHKYMLADYQYITKKYEEAISNANYIINLQKKEAKPRLYKLIAYSQAALGDSTQAEKSMQVYFTRQKTEEFISKDYELMAFLTEAVNPDKAAAIPWYRKAIALEKDTKSKLGYMQTVADIQKTVGNREREAVWRERIYTTKEQPSNLDIYNWGVALYMAADYTRADSVFGIYSDKYPDQVYGPLWQARCNSIIDSTMEQGLAVPYFKKLIDVASTDSVKNKSILLKAYGYLGSYEANKTKDYESALGYFEKMLALDPENSDAKNYVDTIKKWIESNGQG